MTPLPFPRLRRLARSLRQLARREDGSIAVETVIIFPLLTWGFLATFVYFDAFRAETRNDKASYTLADILSRETGFVNDSYIDTLYRLQRMLAASTTTPRLRVSVVRWDDRRDRFSVVWTEPRGTGVSDLRDNDVRTGSLAARLPVAADGDRLIVMETWSDYEPAFSIGIDAYEIDTLSVVRPRYAPQVCFDPRGRENINDAYC